MSMAANGSLTPAAHPHIRPATQAALAVALLAMAGCGSPQAKAPATGPASTPLAIGPSLKAVGWDDVPQWESIDPLPALGAFRKSCSVIGSRPEWDRACANAIEAQGADPAAVRKMFESDLAPFKAEVAGADTGRLTGYFEPMLRGSRTPDGHYRHPIYSPPGDLLDRKDPRAGGRLKGPGDRGRLVGGKVVPYLTRAEIDADAERMRRHAFLWVNSLGDLFFLHIQGSGRVLLEDGSVVRVGFADHNGHPYVSLANHLIKGGHITRANASMEGIKAFIALNEGRAKRYLAANPRYIFFRELPPGDDGPIGALGVPLTALHSIAVDDRHVPLGAPAVIRTQGTAGKEHNFTRLVVAQDVGGAIKGEIRADYFWGFGDQAGRLAESTNQPFSMWVLLPRSQ